VRAGTANASVHARDSVFTLALGDGVFVSNAGTLQSHVVVERSSVLRSGGLGVFVLGVAPGFATATLIDSLVSDHASTDINAQGSTGTGATISGATVRRNLGNSLLQAGSAFFGPFGNNALTENAFGISGTITTLTLQ
jgi:hypothetical protein